MAKYDKERIIGTGSYGNVWLVRSQVKKNTYVMKEIKLNSLNAVERQQAMMEATLLSKCRHKNIIKYKEAINDRPRRVLQIVMEYAEGGDLYSAIIKQKGVPFKEHTVISWFIQICLALQYIHYQNILHRDLKTQNIFLTLNNVIKVGDFGIARALKEPKEFATTAIGTPYYLSPEICQRKPYNFKSDMWAVGCILFEMSALVHPFQAYSFPHLVTLILKGKKKELPKRCSPLIADLVDSLLCINPNRRPSTDDVLAIPALQPYLSEYLALFDNDLLSTEKSETNSRRHSLDDVLEEEKHSRLKRRASVSSTDSRAPKTRASVSNCRKEALKVKCSLNFHNSKKVCKPSPSSKGIFAERNQNTFRVFNTKLSSISLNRREKSTTRDDSVSPRSSADIIRHITSKKTRNKTSSVATNELDFGYQSETFKALSSKTVRCKEGLSMDKTIRNVQSEEMSSLNEAFIKEDPRKRNGEDGRHMSTIHCHHSNECHQCMFNMLWKNRIRSPAGFSGAAREKTKFENKLKDLFGKDLFSKLYKALYSHWETKELEESENIIQSIIDSLNYKQIQSLPLMMQLIQLDILKK